LRMKRHCSHEVISESLAMMGVTNGDGDPYTPGRPLATMLKSLHSEELKAQDALPEYRQNWSVATALCFVPTVKDREHPWHDNEEDEPEVWWMEPDPRREHKGAPPTELWCPGCYRRVFKVTPDYDTVMARKSKEAS